MERTTVGAERGGESHPSVSELARWVDEVPDARAHRHLDVCERCRHTLAELRAQSRALEGLPTHHPPPEDRTRLEDRLASEGLLAAAAGYPRRVATVMPVAGGPSREQGSVGPSRRTGWLSIAAGVTLFVSGGATGMALSGSMGSWIGEEAAVREPSSGSALADDSAAAPERTLEASAQRVRLAEGLFVEAMLGYRDHLREADPTLLESDPVDRLVMLENLLAATEAAVREAPADPFFNGLLLSTQAEHRATVEDLTFTIRSF